MSIVGKKREIFGQIAALRTSCEGFPKLQLKDSMCSIDNSTNPLDFLMDLLKVTIGFEALSGILTKTLTYELGGIEIAIKKALKAELKSLVSCGVNPTIPDFFLHQNINGAAVGVDLDLRKVDYMGIMLIDPNSAAGLMSYEDTNGGLNSTDMHTYLFETIQLDGTQTDWGSQTLNNDILSFEFNSVGPPNNIVNVHASEYYSNPANGKKLTDLNNDYIDSINLFGSGLMINALVDSLFGSVSLEIGKSKDQIKKEVEVEHIIECFLSNDVTTTIDDTFFEFSNEEIRLQEEESTNRGKGVRVLANCDNVETTVPTTTLTGITAGIKSATTAGETFDVITKGVNDIASHAAENVDDKNKITAKLSFIDAALKKLMVKMGNVLLSPKVISIFAVNHYIVYGTNLEDPIEWMKKNKVLINAIISAIRDTIIKILLEEAIKNIKDIVKCAAQQVVVEYAKNQAAQLASLVGIPQHILRMITGLGGLALSNVGRLGLGGTGKGDGAGCKKGGC
jgi:hypothetical protein